MRDSIAGQDKRTQQASVWRQGAQTFATVISEPLLSSLSILPVAWNAIDFTMLQVHVHMSAIPLSGYLLPSLVGLIRLGVTGLCYFRCTDSEPTSRVETCRTFTPFCRGNSGM